MENPVFRIGELTPELISARVHDGDEGMTMFRFGVLYDSGVLVEVNAKGVSAEWVYEIFTRTYVENTPHFHVSEWHYRQVPDGLETTVTIQQGDKQSVVHGRGNGRLDSVSNCLKRFLGQDYTLAVYEEHALDTGSSSKAAAYVGIVQGDRMYWGCGIDPDIIKASVQALVVAINRLL